MPRRLLMLNALLGVLAALFLVHVARQATTPFAPLPEPRTRPAPVAAAAQASPPTVTAPGMYGIVASRNLFSPTRSEATTAAAGPAVAMNLPKPNLFGVVLRDGAPIAYVEDPTTKRVAGYRVGDSIAGGTVKTIASDHIVIARPDGNMDVRLRDPSRPRPAPVAPPAQPGVQPPAAGQQVPQLLPAPGQATGPQQVPPGFLPPAQVPPVPGAQPVEPPTGATRRQLPPNLLRRVPPGVAPDASR
jgi:hypothetical protein